MPKQQVHILILWSHHLGNESNHKLNRSQMRHPLPHDLLQIRCRKFQYASESHLNKG